MTKDMNQEKKDDRFWWTFPPYYKNSVPGVDGGSHDIPAIIATAHAQGYAAALAKAEEEIRDIPCAASRDKFNKQCPKCQGHGEALNAIRALAKP